MRSLSASQPPGWCKAGKGRTTAGDVYKTGPDITPPEASSALSRLKSAPRRFKDIAEEGQQTGGVLQSSQGRQASGADLSVDASRLDAKNQQEGEVSYLICHSELALTRGQELLLKLGPLQLPGLDATYGKAGI